MRKLLLLICGFFPLAGHLPAGAQERPETFGQDAAFLKQHVETLVLQRGDHAIAVVPAYQGRVMTSTTGGDGGPSFGWINYDLIASGQTQPHMHAFGGEERFWIGPEGGQFSIFFKPGSAFEFKDWQVPAPIDTETYEVIGKSSDEIIFGHHAQLTNWSGQQFNIQIRRSIRLEEPTILSRYLDIKDGLDDLQAVAYRSSNTIRNVGQSAWTEKTGALSIWLLGMYKPSPNNVVVCPFVKGSEEQLGPIVTDDYFGKVSADRLKVDKQQGVIYFKADGLSRGKIGISPRRATPWVGGYAPDSGILTLVHVEKPQGETRYVNSLWAIQDQPFAGDMFNSYNDGPNESGGILGPFYELESSSPAAFLEPQGTIRFDQLTVHLHGSTEQLDAIARAALGVGLDQIERAFD